MYSRVLPQALFQESNLLENVGKLIELIDNNRLPGLRYEYSGEPFIVGQHSLHGGLFINNIYFYDCDDEPVHVYRHPSEGGKYSLIIRYKDEDRWVFYDNGELMIYDRLFSKDD